MHKFGKFLSFIISAIGVAVVAGSIAVIALIIRYGKDLPDYKQLADYNPAVVTRLYASDGQMVAEYANEKRLFVPINAIPKSVKHAFIAAEDKNFYTHPGIDITSIVKAAVKNIDNYGKNKRLVGASTITQQVVKNFLLTNERSLTRKIKEAILAFRVTQSFSKDRILELYLNEIYLGNKSYGVAAAALNYFNKSLAELSVEEAAMLAALPKAPSNLDPRRFPERAIERRNWVINRMYKENYIDEKAAHIARNTPINIVNRNQIQLVNEGFFADTVKKQLTDIYGEKKVLEEGYSVRVTLDTKLQKKAEKALMQGLLSYDKRHGYKGAFSKIKDMDNWREELKNITPPEEIGNWHLATVLGYKEENNIEIGFKDGTTGIITFNSIKWAKKYIDDDTVGDEITSPNQVANLGDVILVSQTDNDQIYQLQQIPEVNGSIVAMDPYTGKVLAMVGGYYYGKSQFNRAIQAKRQPGSAIKPFVYLAALENGFSPNSIIVDEEIQLERGKDMLEWRPQNHSGKFYGPTTLRVGLEKSRNAMTVRLVHLMGINKVVEISERLNLVDNPERTFALVLGATETNLVNLLAGYSSILNGGKKIKPSFIGKVQDRNGKIIYKEDTRNCQNCLVNEDFDTDNIEELIPPILDDNREQIIDPIVAYQVTSMLEGAINRGTGRKAKNLKRTLAGKTGTTNDSFDAWFLGFSPDIAVGVYVGFDNPRSLGKKEYGSSAALPIWIDFMKEALADKPDRPFRRPEGVKLIKIDSATGLLPTPTTPKYKIIYEAFKEGQEPTKSELTQPTDEENSITDPDKDFGVNEVY